MYVKKPMPAANSSPGQTIPHTPWPASCTLHRAWMAIQAEPQNRDIKRTNLHNLNLTSRIDFLVCCGSHLGTGVGPVFAGGATAGILKMESSTGTFTSIFLNMIFCPGPWPAT